MKTPVSPGGYTRQAASVSSIRSDLRFGSHCGYASVIIEPHGLTRKIRKTYPSVPPDRRQSLGYFLRRLG